MANKHEKIISLVDHCGNKNSNQLNQLILHTHLERLKKKKNLNLLNTCYSILGVVLSTLHTLFHFILTPIL